MDDALLVGGLECLGNLPRNRHRLGEGIGALGNSIRERRTVRELEDQNARTSLEFCDTMNRGDVRMVEGRQQAAACSNRASQSGSLDTAAGRTLMATSRPSVVSCAR